MDQREMNKDLNGDHRNHRNRHPGRGDSKSYSSGVSGNPVKRYRSRAEQIRSNKSGVKNRNSEMIRGLEKLVK